MQITYAHALIAAGVDPLFVQQQVGHSWASTTAVYTSVGTDAKNRMLGRRAGPRVRHRPDHHDGPGDDRTGDNGVGDNGVGDNGVGDNGVGDNGVGDNGVGDNGVGDNAVSGPVGYRWHLRRVMAERGMFATSELVPRLAERGVRSSASRSTGWSPGSRSGCRCRRWPRCTTPTAPPGTWSNPC